jgi:hypothetical protein
MKKYYFQHIFLFCALFLISCNSYPDTPEKVVERYTNYLNAGDCENAKEYCYGNAKEIIEVMAEGGCEPTNIIVDSIKCEIRDTNCVCSSYEKHPIMGDRVVYYHLALDSNKWKLDNLLKNSNGPWSWWDYGHDLFESGKDEFENPIQVINLIFNNYIKYDKGVESNDDLEAMEKCLKQLGANLQESDLLVIVNVWMYYNVKDFGVKKLTESILKKNKRNSKKAINTRIKQKYNWEEENLRPYSKLEELLKSL